jgi:hypothetical protein
LNTLVFCFLTCVAKTLFNNDWWKLFCISKEKNTIVQYILINWDPRLVWNCFSSFSVYFNDLICEN